MVDRYNMIGRDFGARMDISPKGDWVRYRDLARLESCEVLYKNRVSVVDRDDLIDRLEVKANMIALGERIEWGSDTEIMLEAAAALRALKVGEA